MFTRTKRADWHTATYSARTECSQSPALNCPDGTVTIDVWYDVYTKSWIVQTLDGNGWDTGPSEYVYGRAEAFDIATRWAACPH